MTVVVKEKSRAVLTVRFLNEAGRLAVPSAISYRIDCRTSGQMVRDWTAVTPGSVIQIGIPSSENAILAGEAREERVVTIQATYGADDLVNDEYLYVVQNLQFVS